MVSMVQFSNTVNISPLWCLSLAAVRLRISNLSNSLNIRIRWSSMIVRCPNLYCQWEISVFVEIEILIPRCEEHYRGVFSIHIPVLFFSHNFLLSTWILRQILSTHIPLTWRILQSDVEDWEDAFSMLKFWPSCDTVSKNKLCTLRSPVIPAEKWCCSMREILMPKIPKMEFLKSSVCENELVYS